MPLPSPGRKDNSMCAAVMDTLRRYMRAALSTLRALLLFSRKKELAHGVRKRNSRSATGDGGSSVRWSREVDRVVEDAVVRQRIGLSLASSSSR